MRFPLAADTARQIPHFLNVLVELDNEGVFGVDIALVVVVLARVFVDGSAVVEWDVKVEGGGAGTGSDVVAFGLLVEAFGIDDSGEGGVELDVHEH